MEINQQKLDEILADVWLSHRMFALETAGSPRAGRTVMRAAEGEAP